MAGRDLNESANPVWIDTKPRDNAIPVSAGGQGADAFARLRVSQPGTLFDSKMLYDKAPLTWSESITNTSGNATSTWENASVTMHAEAGDTIIRQSKVRMNYQPGKSQLASFTGVIPGGTGVTSRAGLFTTADGLFFQRSGDTVSVVVRNNTTDTAVTQANWNVDTLDGAGPSGVTIDWDKAQIFFIDYEWLGVGKIRFGLFLDGLPWLAHIITNINALTVPYLDTPNQPVRYEVAVEAGGESVDMHHICSTVMSEGGLEPTGIVRTFTTGGTAITATTAGTIYALLGVRLKGTHLDATILMRTVNVMAATADDFEWLLLFNPTVAGTFTYSNVTNSALQVATGATANTITADSWDALIAAGFTKNTAQGGTPVLADLENALRLGSTIAGTPDEIVLAVRPLGASAEMHATLTVRELV